MKSQSNKYRIIIADDHHVFRLGLKKLIENSDEFEIVAEAGNGRELIERIETVQCDLVISDISMPEMSGIDAIMHIKSRNPEIKVMVLSMHKDREYFRKILSTGIDGYLLKDDIFEKIVSAIRSIRRGVKSFSDELTSNIIEDYNTIQDSTVRVELLTKREKEVLVMIAEGMSNKQIAEKIDISVRTVEAHRAHLMDKLDLENVQEIVKFAMQMGLI